MLDDLLLLPDQGVPVLQGLLGHRVEDANAVEVGNTGSLGQLLLDVLDVGIVWELNLGGKTPDGLLRSCNGNPNRSNISHSLFFYRGVGHSLLCFIVLY